MSTETVELQKEFEMLLKERDLLVQVAFEVKESNSMLKMAIKEKNS